MGERFAVEPTNLGEVLACGGIAWLVSQEQPDAECGFTPEQDGWQFEAPFPRARLERLIDADPTVDDQAVWLGGVRLDWWQQGSGLNQPFKFWAGPQSARSVLTNLVRAARQGDAGEWLDFQAGTTGRLGVDPQGSWDSLALGWSVNEHTHLQYLCRPYVELLAFLALQRFLVQGDRDGGFRYHLWRPAPLTVAVLGFAGAARHSQGGWVAPIASSGSNKYLKPGLLMEE